MLKLFRLYALAQAQFHKARPDIEKALDPVLVFFTMSNKSIRYCSVDILSSKSSRYAGWKMSLTCLRARKVIVHIY